MSLSPNPTGQINAVRPLRGVIVVDISKTPAVFEVHPNVEVAKSGAGPLAVSLATTGPGEHAEAIAEAKAAFGADYEYHVRYSYMCMPGWYQA